MSRRKKQTRIEIARGTWAYPFCSNRLLLRFLWRRSGQTLAMQTWRTAGLDLDGKNPIDSAVVRYCLAWLWCTRLDRSAPLD